MATTGKLDLLQGTDVAFIIIGKYLHENSFMRVSITKIIRMRLCYHGNHWEAGPFARY